MQRIDVDIVAQGEGWRLSRVEVAREPLLGALVETGPWEQTRVIESGGVAVVTPDGGALYGPGHRLDVAARRQFLYVPIGVTEWVLSKDAGAAAEDAPEVEYSAPASDPVPLPLPEEPPVAGLYPDWATPWLALPRDVGTWASCLDIRSTSLAQRCKRLSNVTPKKLLSAARATIAFELAAHYRGRGADLALDTGYSSHGHLSADVSDRFGISLTELLSDDVSPQLDWLRLVRGAVR